MIAVPATSKLSFRRQLLEARADVQRHIEIPKAGPVAAFGGPQFGPVIIQLMATLKKIDETLAEEGNADA